MKTRVTVFVETGLLAAEYARIRPDAPLGASEERMIEQQAAENLLRKGRFTNLQVAGEDDDDS